MADRASILGAAIDRLSMDETVARVSSLIADGACHQHVVVNAAKLVHMQTDQRLRDIVNQCHLVNADGQSVVWASRFLGDSLPERVAGIDLMVRLLDEAERAGYRVFFFGATEVVVNRVVEVCRARYTRLQIAGWRSGYFDDSENPGIVQQIRQSRPQILFVALGTPEKEYWINTHLQDLAVPFCMGVGGSFDVLAGHTRRAPKWMQTAGLEWFFRFLQEPCRMWKRYLSTNVRFLWLLAVALVRRSATVKPMPGNRE